MDRIHNILNGIQKSVSAQKTFDGKKRNDLKDSDFLFPETRSFPITTPADVKDAISNYGRMSGKMSYDAFLNKLYNMCKRKGSEFVAALPETSKEKLDIKSKSDTIFDDRLILNPDPQNTNEADDIEDESDDDSMLELDEYKTEYLQMVLGSLNKILHNVSDILNNSDLERVKENLTEPWLQGMIAVVDDNMGTIHDFVKFYDSEDDSEETEAARKEIDRHRKHHHKEKPAVNLLYRGLPTIITHVNMPHNEQNEHESHEEPNENNELTTETNETPSESPSISTPAAPAADRPGLWENIRRKKEREGKNYKPAKTGDKDRPDTKTWKKLTKENKQK